MKHVKMITIDQLKPGMFIVGMDQPWYRTPFLLHRRFIRDAKEIALLRQYGITELKIDPSKGLDVDSVTPGARSSTPSLQETDIDTQPRDPAKPADGETPPEPALETARNSAQQSPPHMQQESSSPSHRQATHAARLVDNATSPTSTDEVLLPPSSAKTNTTQPSPTSHVRNQDVAAEETYREVTCSMDRMFEALEMGIVPRLDSVRMVVTNVVSRVLDDSTSMLSLLSLQKMKRFDRTLASHALDVCTLALIVGHAYGVTGEELDTLGAGALLHDIGYIRLPRNLYRRSHDLSEQEHATMQQHPVLGLAVLRDVQEDREVVLRIVAEHHECGNGNGFPRKLKGDSISLLAQLVGLTDIYDGMVSRRGGHPGMLPHDAIKKLFRLGDTGKYEKDLIQSMIGSLGVYPIGSLILMNTGEQAVVVGINGTQRLKPVVKIITGPQGGSYPTPIRVDLGAQTAETSQRTITKVLDPLQERVNVAMFLDGVHDEAA
ncbi:MAG: DUF3391 domain-containing protein [Nitrospira sp.]|nr:MAG: DUF3391 domain-containing protein [Nitrospira sp.]